MRNNHHQKLIINFIQEHESKGDGYFIFNNKLNYFRITSTKFNYKKKKQSIYKNLYFT